MASGGCTRPEQSQAGYVIMFCGHGFASKIGSSRDPGILGIPSCPNELHPVPPAAEAMGLSGAIAQGDWVHAIWSEMALGLSPREWREREDVPPLISVTESEGGPSEDRRSAIDLAIIREDLSRPLMFLWWVDGKAQVADALDQAPW